MSMSLVIHMSLSHSHVYAPSHSPLYELVIHMSMSHPHAYEPSHSHVYEFGIYTSVYRDLVIYRCMRQVIYMGIILGIYT